MSSSWTSINQPPTPSPSPPHSYSPSATETGAMSNPAPSPTSGDSQAAGQKKKRKPLPNHPQQKTPEDDIEKKVPTYSTSVLMFSSAPSTSITPPPPVAAVINATVTASIATSQDSPSWAHKYEHGHLGDLSVPLKAGEFLDYSNHFKGNGKKDCPSYPGKDKKPSWPYVAYVLLASVPGGNMRVDVVYRMGIEWVPKMAKLDNNGNPSNDNQSCRAALSRGGGRDLFISYNINKVDYWRLANRGEVRPEPRNNGGRKRKAEDENMQDEAGKSSIRAEQPAAKKKAATKIRLILQGKREDVEASKFEALNVPKQNRTFSEEKHESGIWAPAPFSRSSHQAQDDLSEHLNPVTPREKMCNPGKEIKNDAQQPVNLLSLISVDEKNPRDMANVLSPQELPNTPVGNLLAENNVDEILRASPSEYKNLQLRKGYPGVAVGPHPYGTPGALPDANAAHQLIAERVDKIVDVSNDEHQTTNSYVTSSESDPNEWVTKAVNILVQMKRDSRSHNLGE